MAPILPADVRAHAADLLAGRFGLAPTRAERWVLTAEYDRQLQLGWVATREDGSHHTSRQWFYPRDDRNWEELLSAAQLAIDLALLDGEIDPAVFWLPVPAATAFLPGEEMLTAQPQPRILGRRVPAVSGRLLATLAVVAPLYLVLAGLYDEYTVVPDTARELWTVGIAVCITWALHAVGGIRRARP